MDYQQPELLLETSPRQARETATLCYSYEWLENVPRWWPNWMRRLRVCWAFSRRYLTTDTIAGVQTLKGDGLNWLREAVRQQGHLHTWVKDALGNTETCHECHLGRFTDIARWKEPPHDPPPKYTEV